MELIPHVIDGAYTESANGARFDSVDPWTRRPWARGAAGGPEDAARAGAGGEEAGGAVTAGRRAFGEGPWPRMGRAERGGLLHRLADLIVEHARELALADREGGNFSREFFTEPKAVMMAVSDEP